MYNLFNNNILFFLKEKKKSFTWSFCVEIASNNNNHQRMCKTSPKKTNSAREGNRIYRAEIDSYGNRTEEIRARRSE